MEPITVAAIASGALTALQPFAAKGIEKLFEKTAEEGFNERRAIWEKVKGLFKTDDLILLNLLEEAGTNEKAQGKLEGKLETHLEANPEIAKELEVLLKNLPANQTMKQNTITQSGTGHIAVQDVTGGDIKINQK